MQTVQASIIDKPTLQLLQVGELQMLYIVPTCFVCNLYTKIYVNVRTYIRKIVTTVHII